MGLEKCISGFKCSVILGIYVKFRGGTVDGRNPANQLVDSLSHYLQGF